MNKEELKPLSPEDIYLINRFGMTREAIKNVLMCYRAEVYDIAQDVIEHCDFYVDPKAYRDFTEEEWEKIEKEHDSEADGYFELYEFPDPPVKAFMDVISWRTKYGGHSSAIEAVTMAGFKDWSRWDQEKAGGSTNDQRKDDNG